MSTIPEQRRTSIDLRRRVAQIAAVGALIVGTTATGVIAAGAVHTKPATHKVAHADPRGTVGVVTAVSPTGFTITTHAGVVLSIAVSSSTTYLDEYSSAPSLANVVIGEHVAVFGVLSSGTITATAVAIGDHGLPAAFGIVTAVSGGGFTMETPKGDAVTVNVTGATTYLDEAVATPSVANVTVGSKVAVYGVLSSATIAATAVAIAGAGSHGIPGGFGTVASVGTGSFTITTASGVDLTIDVSGSTTYIDEAVSSPSFANVTVGEHVAVFGVLSAGSLAATTIAIGAPISPAPLGQWGTVKAVGTGNFTIATHGGATITVQVSSSTTYLDALDSSPSIADVTVGAHVVVFGVLSAGTEAATAVAINPHAQPPVFGTVTSVGTSSFVIELKAGTTVTVDVSGSTTFLDEAVGSPSLANVAVDQHVAVFGPISAGTVSATAVAIADRGLHGGTGTVTSVGTSGFTIVTHAGITLTVTVSGATTFLDEAAGSPSFATMAIGQRVAVFGPLSAGTITATAVAIAGPGDHFA